MALCLLSAPVSVELIVTHDCNHKCTHCFNPDRRKPIDIVFDSKEKLPVLVDELVENGVWKVVVTGGEPLTDKPLTLDVLKMLNEKGIESALNTNLTLIDEKFIDELLKLPVVPPIFGSLPSLEEKSCDMITGVQGSYQKILNGIRLCEKSDLSIGINTVYTNISVCDADSFIAFLSEHPKINHVSISPVIPPEYDSGNHNFTLNNDDLLYIRDMLLEIERKTKVSVGSSIPLPLCIVGSELLKRNHMSMCIAGRAHCTIDLKSGSVNACSHIDNCSNNLYRDGLKECWRQLSIWRDDTLLNTECCQCQYISLCSGECRILTKNGSNLRLNHLADITIELSDAHYYTDNNSSFKLNPELKIRDEDFGATLFVYNRYMFVGRVTVAFINYIRGIGEFDLQVLRNKFVLDDNFYLVFRQLVLNGFILVH